MINRRWVPVIVRFGKQEFENVNAYCKKYTLIRSDLIRESTRDRITNTDPTTGALKQKDGVVDLTPLIDSIAAFGKKLENLEKKLDSQSECKEIKQSNGKKRIAEIILQELEKTKERTTSEKLLERIKSIDPSLENLLYAPCANGFAVYEEVLMDLHQQKMLFRHPSGIIEPTGAVKNA